MRLLRSFAPLRTVRARLLLLALLVEALMLGLLLSNSLRLLHDHMGEQAREHAAQIAPVLNAALVAPLAQLDHATVQAVLDESRAARGIDYLAVLDTQGAVVALSGWPSDKHLPTAANGFDLDTDPPRYHVAQPVQLAGQVLGSLQFGLDLSRLVQARRSLLWQGLGIAVVEVLLSAALLATLGLLITRQLSVLTRASRLVAAGNATPPPVPEGDDDVGRLGAAFNALSRPVAERIGQISAARDEVGILLARLEHEHARLTALLSAMGVGVLFSDTQGRVVYANASVLALWSLAPEDAGAGAVLSQLGPRMARQMATAPMGDTLWLGADNAEWVLRDGRILTQRRTPVRDEQGQTLGWLWLFHDVTAERANARQLVAAKDAAEAASVAKAAFLATMSHEIRTPMNGIVGMTELTLDTPLNDEQREYLNVIRASTDALMTIVNDILDFSKIEAHRVELESVPFEPRRLLDELLALFQTSAGERAVSLGSQVAEDVPRVLLGDPTRLRQVLSNLLSNAIKFTRDGSVTVTLSAQAQADGTLRCDFAVTDSGIGIPSEKLRTIFEPFTQADHTTTRKYGGTGLGLAIVKRLVELMGGEVHAESVPGHGSVFRFSAVLAPPPPPGDGSAAARAPAAAPAFGAAGAAGSGLRVLVAEDHRVNQQVVLALLRKHGHHPHLAENGLEAVHLFTHNGPFDLVLMDMQMPEMDGLEATRRIRAVEQARTLRPTPVVALTANASAADRQECLAAGMTDFLAKPFRSADLLQLLSRMKPPEAAPAP